MIFDRRNVEFRVIKSKINRIHDVLKLFCYMSGSIVVSAKPLKSDAEAPNACGLRGFLIRFLNGYIGIICRLNLNMNERTDTVREGPANNIFYLR